MEELFWVQFGMDSFPLNSRAGIRGGFLEHTQPLPELCAFPGAQGLENPPGISRCPEEGREQCGCSRRIIFAVIIDGIRTGEWAGWGLEIIWGILHPEKPQNRTKTAGKKEKILSSSIFLSVGEWRHCFILARIKRNRFVLTLPGLCRENHPIHGICPEFLQAKPREIHRFHARRSQMTQILYLGSCWLLIISAFVLFFV